MNDTKITMKSLARQKADVRAKIARQHSELSQTYWDTLAPFYRLGNSPFSVLKRFSVGVALFEGAVTSLRMKEKYAVYSVNRIIIFHRKRKTFRKFSIFQMNILSLPPNQIL